MRRTHIALGALTLVATACSGSSAAPPSTLPTTTLPTTTTSTTPPSTMVIEPERDTDVIEVWAPAALIGPIGDAAAAFEIESGIDVQVVASDTEATLSALLEDPAAGPDAFIGPHQWLMSLTKAGVAEPVTIPPFVVGGAASAVTLRATTYALPFGLDAVAQFRNQALLTTSPTTIESLAAGCGGGPCLVLSETSVPGHWPFLTGLGGYLFGPDEFDGWDKDDVGVDTEQALAGGAVLESIVGGAGILGDAGTTARQRFRNGDAPLFWGDLADLAALQQAGFDVAVEPLPTIGDQPSPVPLQVTAIWVNAFSPDKGATTELVESFLSQPESSRVLAVTAGFAPVDVDYDDDSDIAPFTQAGVHGDPIPPIQATELAWNQLTEAFTAIRGGQAAATALEAAASTIRAEA